MRYELYNTKTATVKKKSNIQCNLTYNTGALLFDFSLINAVKEAKVLSYSNSPKSEHYDQIRFQP